MQANFHDQAFAESKQQWRCQLNATMTSNAMTDDVEMTAAVVSNVVTGDVHMNATIPVTG